MSIKKTFLVQDATNCTSSCNIIFVQDRKCRENAHRRITFFEVCTATQPQKTSSFKCSTVTVRWFVGCNQHLSNKRSLRKHASWLRLLCSYQMPINIEWDVQSNEKQLKDHLKFLINSFSHILLHDWFRLKFTVMMQFDGLTTMSWI